MNVQRMRLYRHVFRILGHHEPPIPKLLDLSGKDDVKRATGKDIQAIQTGKIPGHRNREQEGRPCFQGRLSNGCPAGILLHSPAPEVISI